MCVCVHVCVCVREREREREREGGREGEREKRREGGRELTTLWDGEKSGHCSHGRSLQLVLFLVLLFDRVSFRFRLDCRPQWLYQLLNTCIPVGRGEETVLLIFSINYTSLGTHDYVNISSW